MSILEKIISEKRDILRRRKEEFPQDELLRGLKHPLTAARFAEKIGSDGCHLIAEAKKASPSAGLIRADFDLEDVVRSYAKGGASCLSVLTEEKFFQGDLSFLKLARQAVSLPLLRKDFIIDAYQIYESKVHGADAILLIASLLEEAELEEFLHLAETLNLDVVVEVHSQQDLKKVLKTRAKIIGLNIRDLTNFSLHLDILPRLVADIPPSKLVICESGIRTLDDLAFAKRLDVDAVLVGEALMREQDILAKTKEFVGFLR